MVSNSRYKINQTWSPHFSPTLYKGREEVIKSENLRTHLMDGHGHGKTLNNCEVMNIISGNVLMG